MLLTEEVSGGGPADWVAGAGVWETSSETAAESLACSKGFCFFFFKKKERFYSLICYIQNYVYIAII